MTWTWQWRGSVRDHTSHSIVVGGFIHLRPNADHFIWMILYVYIHTHWNSVILRTTTPLLYVPCCTRGLMACTTRAQIILFSKNHNKVAKHYTDTEIKLLKKIKQIRCTLHNCLVLVWHITRHITFIGFYNTTHGKCALCTKYLIWSGKCWTKK